MGVVDANLLVYARHPGLSQHEHECGWLDAQLNGAARVGQPWSSPLAFIRISINPRVFEMPEATLQAWRQVEDWPDSDLAWVPTPSQWHRFILGELLQTVGASPQLVADAHLTAPTIEHGLTLCSTDGDVARRSGLRWAGPLRGCLNHAP